jgi:hypothetical protein
MDADGTDIVNLTNTPEVFENWPELETDAGQLSAAEGARVKGVPTLVLGGEYVPGPSRCRV